MKMTHLFVVLVCTVFSLSAYAEEGKNQGVYTMSLEELMDVKISVASTFQESLLDAGSAVSSLRSSDWKNTGSRQTFTPLERVPGIMVFSNFGGMQSVSIRGYSKTSSSLRGVSLLLDGVPMTDSYSGSPFFGNGFIDLPVLEQVEVIRGPASTLYGSDAFHGVISLKTWTHDEDINGAEGQYGSFNWRQGHLKTVKLLSPHMKLTVMAGLSGQSGVDMPYVGTSSAKTANWIEGRNMSYGSAIAKLNIGKSTELGLYYFKFDADSWNAAGIIHPQSTQLRQAGRNTDTVMSKLSHTFELPSSFLLDTQLSYGTENADLFSTLVALRQDRHNVYNTKRGTASVLLKRERQEDFPVQLLFGYTADIHKWGNAYNTDTGTYFQEASTDKYRTINSLTAQTDTRVLKSLNFLAGARFDVYSDGYQHLSPRVGTIYHLDSDSAIKLLYGHAFRAPVAVELYGQGFKFGENLGPENINSWDLIYMHQGKSHLFSMGLFLNEWSNVISLNNTTRTFVNSGANHAYGLETELKYQPGPLGGFLTGSIVKSRNVDGPNGEYSAFPTVMLNWGANYKWKSAHMDFTLFNRHLFKQTSTSSLSSDYLGPYFRTDLGLLWDCGPAMGEKSGRYEVAMNLRNLLNRKNFTGSPFDVPGGFEEPGIAATLNARAFF
jgi:outer membrane cobalamin receptor